MCRLCRFLRIDRQDVFLWIAAICCLAATCVSVLAEEDKPTKSLPEAIEILNVQRAGLGLMPYVKDEGLTNIARRRLRFNARRGSWTHYLANGSPVFRDTDGTMVGYGTGNGEGCGTSRSRNRVNCCYASDPGSRRAGIAGRLVNGQWWWLIVVGHGQACRT